MNILIFNWRDPKNPKAGGAEIVTHEYARAWVKAGHKVTWFSSTFDNVKAEEMIDGIKILRKGGAVFDVQVQAFIWYVFKDHDTFDLVIDQFHGIPFFTPVYVREKKLAFIHEVAKDVWKLNPWTKPFNLIPYFFGTLFEPLMFKTLYRSTQFLTVSQSTKDDLMAWGIPTNSITIIYNGTNAQVRSSISQKEKNKTIIVLGAISEDKGIKDAMRVFSYLKNDDATYQFWVVGKGDEVFMQQLNAMSETLHIKKNITFWGYVDEKKKYALLSKAHVLLHPSIREGWGLVVIEAASQATPAVVYDVPGLRDSVQNGITGIVVKEKNSEEMAVEIHSLLNNEKQYMKYQENCLKWARKFKWADSFKQSLKLLRNTPE